MTRSPKEIGSDGLTRRGRDLIRGVLAHYPEVRRATLFGSRAIAGVPTATKQGFIAMVCEGPLPRMFVLNWAFTSIKAHDASGTTFPEISKKTFRALAVAVPTGYAIAAYRLNSARAVGIRWNDGLCRRFTRADFYRRTTCQCLERNQW